MNTVLVVVDVQNDFCTGGPLAVPDAEAILPVVNGLMRDFRRVFLTQDWHPPRHISFASSHAGHQVFGRITLPYGEQVLWPDHCVEGTLGAAFHPLLEIPADALVFRKGIHRGIDSYSAFFENDRKTPVGLDTGLREINASEIVLAGLATDYCVLHTAIDARALGYEVTVIESGCRGIDLDGSVADAWSRMDSAGVRRG
jgi:nicotinamidase-related amidase